MPALLNVPRTCAVGSGVAKAVQSRVMKEKHRTSSGTVAKAGAAAAAESVAPDCVRREHDRFEVDLQVSVLSEHNLYAGLAENLSAGGLFIATHQLQPV